MGADGCHRLSPGFHGGTPLASEALQLPASSKVPSGHLPGKPGKPGYLTPLDGRWPKTGGARQQAQAPLPGRPWRAKGPKSRHSSTAPPLQDVGNLPTFSCHAACDLVADRRQQAIS